MTSGDALKDIKFLRLSCIVDCVMGLGIDIEEVGRFRRIPVETNGKFYNSIFTDIELSSCLKYSDPYPHIAGIFAAKEAVIKCSKEPVVMKDITIQKNSYGKVHALVRRNGEMVSIEVSISHTRSLATAVAFTFFNVD